MLNEDQESKMRSIKEKNTKENSLHDSAHRPLCVHFCVQDTSNYTLTEVTNYFNT